MGANLHPYFLRFVKVDILLSYNIHTALEYRGTFHSFSSYLTHAPTLPHRSTLNS